MYTLHYTKDAASIVVRVVLLELGLPFHTVLLDRAGGDADSARYRALHPLGLVPVLETPDGPIFETAAVLLWLADRHGALAPPPQTPERGDFLKWLMFTNTSVHTALLQLFYPERVAGPEQVPAVIETARARMQGFLTILNDAVAAGPAWADAQSPTVLGHYIGMLMRWLQYGGPGTTTYFPLRDYPAIRAMLLALETRPSVMAASEAEGLGANLYTDPDHKG